MLQLEVLIGWIFQFSPCTLLAASQHHYYFHYVWTACERAMSPQLQHHLSQGEPLPLSLSCT